MGAPIMLFGDPLVHDKRLNQVAKRADLDVNVGKFSDFCRILTKNRSFLRYGDSGGPAINRAGNEEIGVVAGIRADLIRDAIREFECRGTEQNPISESTSGLEKRPFVPILLGRNFFAPMEKGGACAPRTKV